VSLSFSQLAHNAVIAQSMGSKGDCFDNAVAESFFATLKKELIHRRAWPTKVELTEVFDYIEAFYNPKRRHSTLGQRSPSTTRTALSPSRPLDAASRLPSVPRQGIRTFWRVGAVMVGSVDGSAR
jgi:transposase InsO family protein